MHAAHLCTLHTHMHSDTPTSDGDGAHSVKHHMCCQWNGSAGCWQRPVRPQPLLHCPPSALPLHSGTYQRSLKGEEKKHTEEDKRSGRRDWRGCWTMEEHNLQDNQQYTKKSMEQNRHALYTCHRYTQCHLSSGQECTKHMCDTAAC